VDRVPRTAWVAIALVVAMDLLALIVLWAPVASINDAVGFIAGGRAILAGVDPYDADRWTAFASALGQPPETRVFGYPPWIALAFAPLALLPVPVASVVWMAGGLAASLAAALALAPRLGWPRVPLVVLTGASWHALLVLVQGQWGFILVALALPLFVAIREGRDGRAGVAWAAMVLAKPQLFVLGSVALGIWALTQGRVRLVLAAAGTIAAAVAAGTLAAPGWIEPYARYVIAVRGVRSTQQPTLAGLAGDLGGPLWPLVWAVLVVALAVVAALAVRAAPRARRGPLMLASGLALSVAAAPYSWSYDDLLVVPLGAAVAGLASDAAPRARLVLLIAVGILFGPLAFALWESAYLRWHDTLSGLVPPLAIVLAFVAARAVVPERRAA
jgi:alpha-1,2-mannosyltransferase